MATAALSIVLVVVAAGRYVDGSAQANDAAYAAASDAATSWRRTTPAERQLALLRLADLVEQRVAGRAAPPRLSACAEGTWFDDCAPDCCVKVLRGATGPRPTIAQRPQGEPLPVALDEAGEVRWS